jgi:ubiquitin-like protein Pup
MSNREQVEKPGQTGQEKPAEVSEPKDLRNEELAKSTDEITDEIDNLLDEVLGEGTALDFVTGYVQRGGQ